MDIWSPEKRSAVMARIRGRDTKPELIVRSLLHRLGLRFSLRRQDLPGKPDIVLWECEVMRDPFAAVEQVLKVIRPEDASLNYGSLPDRRMLMKAAETRLQWNLRR